MIKQFFIYKKVSTILVCLILIANNLNAQSDEDCLMCHEDTELTTKRNGKTISMFVDNSIINKSVHRNVKCASCHKDAAVEEYPHPETLKKINCGSCHSTHKKQLETDIHHKLIKRVGNNTPTCKICHGTHKILVPSLVKNKAEMYCSKCHKEVKLSAPYHTDSEVNKGCIECHEKKDYKAQLTKSVHNKLSCSNCHGDVVNNLDKHQEEPKEGRTEDCYLCHTTIADEHRQSIHGISLAKGINEAAQCWDCHGSHGINVTSEKSSKVYPSNLVSTCGACHDDIEFIQEHELAIKQPGKMYSTSVHGKLVEAGRMDVATCSVCHGIHDIKNRIQPGSRISSVNLPGTCIKCHKEITEEYKQSIHWIGVTKGIRLSPSCNDCHSEHSIHAINTLDKRHEIEEMQEKTCLQCHQNLLLAERYGIESNSAKSYQDSYHGLAVRGGDEEAALCIDCHGVHKILPKSNEESTIHKNNVVQTCKKCHSGATDVFSKSYSHITEEETPARYIEDIVRKVYFWLIVIVIGGMFMHNLLIVIHELRKRYKRSKNEIRIPRFTTNEVIQHFLLLTSFITLAITGFLLKFSLSSSIGMSEMLRQDIHRISAVIMITLSVYHVVYLFVTARGRDVLKGLLPRISDIRTAIQNVLYYLNIRKKHPEFDNYNYIEKAEYWALIWGTLVMGATGFFLWFPTMVGEWAPVWFIKVCETVHFYEAILASLAIIVWHWFFVMFIPKDYPLSFTYIDGKMTLVHYKDEHKLKFKKILIEWLEVKAGKRKPEKLGHYSKLFISAIEKSGINPDEFIKSELDSDEELKAFVKERKLLKNISD